MAWALAARTRVFAAAVAAMAATAGTGAIVAGAAVPAFPNNVVVFPDRDFVSIEGYQDHVGQTALLEILRDGRVIGSAKSAVAAGDVAFEINHPGGVCWGAGTGVNVTPDIRPGDTARISFDGEEAGETTVGNTFVTGDSVVNGATLTVKGTIAPGVNRAQVEQRIVAPDLDDTAIGRRDVRALPGPLTPSPKGGYSSSLTFDGDPVHGHVRVPGCGQRGDRVADGPRRAHDVVAGGGWRRQPSGADHRRVR